MLRAKPGTQKLSELTDNRPKVRDEKCGNVGLPIADRTASSSACGHIANYEHGSRFVRSHHLHRRRCARQKEKWQQPRKSFSEEKRVRAGTAQTTDPTSPNAGMGESHWRQNRSCV